MKTLLLMRHGKSDWSDGALADHDRPLAARGEKAVDRVGRFLAAAGQAPELVIASTACRAASTAERLVAALASSPPLVLVPELYDGDDGEILAAIAATAGACERVVAIGHEPRWSALAGRLVGGAALRLPTGAVAALELPIAGWAELPAARGELLWLVTPKLLAAALTSAA